MEDKGEATYEGEGLNALVAPVKGRLNGAMANIDDWSRAISGCPKGVSAEEGERCPEGTHDGEYIIFTTREKLQANDMNNALDVYEWHCCSPSEERLAGEGTVRMISDGHASEGVTVGQGAIYETQVAAMSATGSDIFFSTPTRLVGQDTDALRDFYDARVGGGFPAPAAEPSCSGEACQNEKSLLPSFGSAASSLFTAGGNLSPGSGTLHLQVSTPSVTVTKAKLKGNALLVTVKMSAQGTVRISGYGLKTTTKSLKAGTHEIQVALTKKGSSMRKHHEKTTMRVSLTVGKQAVAKTTTVQL